MKPYAPRRKVDPGRGTREARKRFAWSFLWSNFSVKNVLSRLRHGRGVSWMVPHDVSADYETQIDGEIKVEIVDSRTGAKGYIWKAIDENHLWDCECMQVVFALIAGILVFDLDEEEEGRGEDAVPAPEAREKAKGRKKEDTEQGQLVLL